MGLPVPRDRSRELRPFTVLVPIAHRTAAQQIADRRHISLSDLFREAVAEKIAREPKAGEDVYAHAR